MGKKEMEEGGGHGDHALIWRDKDKDAPAGSSNAEVVKCWACQEPILDRTCISDGNYHKECLELPEKIKSHLHMKHDLDYTLFSFDRLVSCDLCNKPIAEDCYSCRDCYFDLHIKCTRPPCICQGQEHQFISLLNPSFKSMSYTCNACGTHGDWDCEPRMCTTCQCIVHKRCSRLNPTIMIHQHNHPITLTYNLFQDDPDATNLSSSCGICKRELKTEYGVYVCASCSFVTHVDCALTYETWDKEIVEEMAANDAEAAEDEMAPAAAIKHSSHAHELILVEGEASDQEDNHCNGCLLPILPPFYTCRQCNFCLDKTCIKLPDRWDYKFDLRAEATDLPICDIFQCFCCHKYVQFGFHYVEGDDQSVLFIISREPSVIDVRCAKSLMERGGLIHKGHQHQLFHCDRKSSRTRDRRCIACGHNGYVHLLRCERCDFNLDLGCASLPHKVINDRYDEHPLLLTYHQEDDGCDKYYCLICEKERDPSHWFYCCAMCGFDAHPDCLLGKNPYVRLGSSGTSDGHPHPLTLGEFSEDDYFPDCQLCSDPCDNLALQCCDSQCNFVSHIKCLQDVVWNLSAVQLISD